jgi:hypothetical protein
MQTIFDPVVRDVTSLISQQVTEAREKRNGRVPGEDASTKLTSLFKSVETHGVVPATDVQTSRY